MGKLPAELFERELARLQRELVLLQEYVRHSGMKVVVVFEGRDAAGKGGTIRRIAERMNPRVCRVVALGTPTERERTQWYFQRYAAHLPAGGEIVLFDRSWYNRAGVERVMGFCTEHEYQEFLLTRWLTSGKAWERPRFRVVFLTRSVERAYHILALAAATAHPRRRLVYATTHEGYVTGNDPLFAPIFLDHHGRWQSLVDLHPTAPFEREAVRIPPLVASPFGF